MKIAALDGGRVALVDGDTLIDVSDLADVRPGEWPPVGGTRAIAAFAQEPPRLEDLADRPRIPLGGTRLECPLAWPNKVIAFPANYHDHIDEMRAAGALISPKPANGQGFFLKANSSLSGPYDSIVLPDLPGREVHHECELALVIGTRGRDISREDAMNHLFGYACLVDFVVRGKEERVMRKSFDSFCPLGPWIVSTDEIADHRDIALSLTVNGELRQSANTRDLIVDIPGMIAMASSVMTLQPGDVIASGTPAGVGPVVDGDEVLLSIAGIGAMRLKVVQGRGGRHPVWAEPTGKD